MIWEARAFSVTHDAGCDLVAGWVFGDLAIDYRPTLFDSDPLQMAACWMITHLPTGLAIMGLMMPEVKTKAVVEELAGLTDWGSIRPETSEWVKKRVQEIVYRVPRLACPANKTIPPWADISDDGDGGDTGPRLTLVHSASP